jgi:hypothetical protein
MVKHIRVVMAVVAIFVACIIAYTFGPVPVSPFSSTGAASVAK